MAMELLRGERAERYFICEYLNFGGGGVLGGGEVWWEGGGGGVGRKFE